MKLFNVSLNDLAVVLAEVSERRYGNNLTFKNYRSKGNHCEFTLRVLNSSGPGARRSRSGTRMVAACWHAHRDVMAALFERYPDARLVSGLATYRGKADFEAKHTATGDGNIGSQAEPLLHRDACACTPAEPAECPHCGRPMEESGLFCSVQCYSSERGHIDSQIRHHTGFEN